LKRAALLLGWCGLAWATLLQGLGGVGLLGPDEPRYAEIAAEMVRRHGYITPRLWGAVWLEKPILYYWQAALSFSLLGISTAAARLPNALWAVGLSAALWAFLRRVHSPRAGVLAAFLSLSTAFLFIFGRAASTDMAISAPLALALMAAYLWLDGRRLGWLCAAAVGLGLAVLAKGPVAGVLAALTLAGFAFSQRRWRLFPALLRPLPLALFALTAAPWYLAAEWKNPQFFHVFFWEHNLQRFATNRFEHPQPFWFYLPVLALALAPWSGWLGLPLAAAARRLRRRGWRGFWRGGDQPLKFYLGWWVAAPVVFFSLSHSKLPGYILPAVPAAVALIAVYAAERWEKLPRWPLALSAALAGLLPAALYAAPWWLAPRALRPPAAALAHDPMLLLLAGGTTLLLLLLAARRRGAALLAATCALVAAVVVGLTHAPLNRSLDVALGGRPLARQLEAQCYQGLPRACGDVPLYAWNLNRDRRYGAQFYLHAPLAEWPPDQPAAGAPANAVVLLDRSALPAFIARYGGARRLARMSRFDPAGSALPAPWLAVRVAPPAPAPQPARSSR